MSCMWFNALLDRFVRVNMGMLIDRVNTVLGVVAEILALKNTAGQAEMSALRRSTR